MKDVILLNNLFNGEYIKDKVGGEIINMYQSDNGNHYIYVNPYGNIHKQWDYRIKEILFIRSIGNGIVKVIAKAKIKEQICINGVFKKNNYTIDPKQKAYIDENNITYGGAKISSLGSESKYYVTFEAEGIYKAKTDIYLTTNKNKANVANNIFVLKEIGKINNQSQKLYIEPQNINYTLLENIFSNTSYWESNKVGKVDLSVNKTKSQSFLSIIKKENDELVNSNLLCHFLENDEKFWADFAEKVLKISDKEVILGKPKITRESFHNIDLLIEVENYAIIIENKIKSRINGQKKDGYSQLEKYVKKTYEHFNKSTNKLFYLLRPDYNNESYKDYNKADQYIEIKYSEIYEIIKIRDINMYFDELKRVVQKHSAEYDNELFEIMDNRFIEQIKNNRQKT